MPRTMSDVGEKNGGMGATGRCKASNDPEDQDNNSGHNGAKTSSSASLEVQKQSSSSSNGPDDQRRSAADGTKRPMLKMTASSSQLTDQPLVDTSSNNKPQQQLQIGPEKEAQNSPKSGKSRRDQFCKVFPDIAETDEVIKSYHCAFVRDILLQGFLYITPNWFCFYSKLLGKKCIKIPVSVVTNITKKKTAIIIPNAIRVITDTEKYVFGSLMSRDNTYQLMLNVWQEKRKVLQTLVPVEQDGSDINADLESVASAGANNTSNTSSKDDYLVSSDGSFCSDLESTGQAEGQSVNCPVDRLQDPTSSVPTANQKTSSDGAKDMCPVFRCSVSNSMSSVGTVPEKLNPGVHSKRPFSTLNELVRWILNFPRTCLLLTISTILVLFLLVSAMLLAYKLINLQMQLATYVGWSYGDGHQDNPDATLKSEPPYRETLQDTYISRHDFHISNVEKIHVILESHVEILNKVNQVLKELQSWAVSSCSSIGPVVENS